MKFFPTKGTNWIVAMAILAIPGALMTGCSKDNNTEINQPKAEGITFAVSGIKIEKSGDIKTKGSVSKMATAPKVYSFDDVDMAVSTDNTVPVRTTSVASSKRGNNLVAAAEDENETIDPNVKYVVYIFDGSTFIKSKELSVGGNENIETTGLQTNKDYTWVALSYRDAVEKPGLTAADVALPANKDVLRAMGTLNLSQSQSVNILFDHVYSRIGIELNTIGVFGEINNTPTITIPKGLNLASGTLNLLSGVLTPSQSTTDINVLNLVDIDPNFKDRKIAYIYTAPIAQNQTFTVNVKNVGITHVDAVGGQVNRTYYTSTAGGNFTFTAPTEAGKSYHIKLDVVESPLVTGTGAAAVKWARSNLFYRGANGGDRNYAFYANNAQTSRADGYFSYLGTVPLTFATPQNQQDPCALVYPVGLWKQPNKNQLNYLTGTAENALNSVLTPLDQVTNPALSLSQIVQLLLSGLGNTLDNLGLSTPNTNATAIPTGTAQKFAQYKLATAQSANAFGSTTSASNNLRFYFNGQITNLGVLTNIGNGTGLAGIDFNNLGVDLIGNPLITTDLKLVDTYDRQAAFWTNEPKTSILSGTIATGTWGYLGVTRNNYSLIGLGSITSTYTVGQKTGEATNIDALGLGLLATSFKNVRCVRAN